MNLAFHFLLNYLVVEIVIGNAFHYLPFILVFSVLMDLDHIPYLLRVKKGVLKKKFGCKSRSRFHELYGLAILSLLVGILYLFLYADVVKVIALCVVLHYAVDFVTGSTRPFYPFSELSVSMRFIPEKARIKTEIVLTGVLGILWLLIV